MKKLIVLLLLVSSPVSAAIYKWTDSDGNVHFGDKPVDQSSATELKIKINNHTGVSHSSGNKKDREYLLKKIDERRSENTEKKKKALALKKKNEKLCNNYKATYQGQIQSNALFTMNADGERSYLSDVQRAARKSKLEKAMAKYCK